MSALACIIQLVCFVAYVVDYDYVLSGLIHLTCLVYNYTCHVCLLFGGLIRQIGAFAHLFLIQFHCCKILLLVICRRLM